MSTSKENEPPNAWVKYDAYASLPEHLKQKPLKKNPAHQEMFESPTRTVGDDDSLDEDQKQSLLRRNPGHQKMFDRLSRDRKAMTKGRKDDEEFSELFAKFEKSADENAEAVAKQVFDPKYLTTAESAVAENVEKNQSILLGEETVDKKHMKKDRKGDAAFAAFLKDADKLIDEVVGRRMHEEFPAKYLTAGSAAAEAIKAQQYDKRLLKEASLAGEAFTLEQKITVDTLLGEVREILKDIQARLKDTHNKELLLQKTKEADRKTRRVAIQLQKMKGSIAKKDDIIEKFRRRLEIGLPSNDE